MRLLLAIVFLAGHAAAAPLLPSPHTVTCFLDADGDGGRGQLEPIYLQIGPCANGAQAGDARLSQGAASGGTIVSGLDDDTSRTHGALTAGYGFFDVDGNGAVSPGDQLYLHVGPLPGTLAPGDIPITGSDAFQPLGSSDSRVGSPVAAAPVAVGGESYAETDGHTGFTIGDVLFLDLDGNAVTSIGDLRLAVGAAASGSSSSQPPSSTAPASSAPPASPNPTHALAPGESTVTPPGAQRGASALGLLGPLSAIAALLALRRRT